MSMHTVGETAVPVAPMASDLESPAARTEYDSLPSATDAFDSDQPAAPDSKPPLGTRL